MGANAVATEIEKDSRLARLPRRARECKTNALSGEMNVGEDRGIALPGGGAVEQGQELPVHKAAQRFFHVGQGVALFEDRSLVLGP